MNIKTKMNARVAPTKRPRGKSEAETGGLYWESERPAVLTVRSRTLRAKTNTLLKKPVVHGTLKLGDWEVTSDNPHTLGTLARMAQADSINYVPHYVAWAVLLEEVLDEELRAMLEPEDAAFVARVRDGFLSHPKPSSRAKKHAKSTRPLTARTPSGT